MTEDTQTVAAGQLRAGDASHTQTNDLTPVAADENRDVDWVDVTGWGVFEGHAIPVAVARKIAERINLYHARRTALTKAQGLSPERTEA